MRLKTVDDKSSSFWLRDELASFAASSTLLARLRIHSLRPMQKSKTSPKKFCVLDMTLNCIWWWDSSSGDLGSMEYPYIIITSMFTLAQIDIIYSLIDQIDLLRNYSYSIGILNAV